MPPGPLQQFCVFLAEQNSEKIPSSVLKHAQWVLLDTLGVILRGSSVPEVGEIARRLGACRLEAGATFLGHGGFFSPPLAAMLNGIAGSSLEFEEGNSRAMGHPAIQLVPALLAAAEEQSSSGERLLTGLVCGYEGASRISRASMMRKGLHPTGTWGVVGSALGVGCLRRRKPEDLAEIAGIASSYAFSPFVKNSFVGKNVASTFAGFVNQAGYLSNLFFEEGIRADEGCLEMTFSKFLSERFDPQVLVAGLGQEYAIAENYFKPYPTCRFTQPSLDALEEILLENKVNPQEVARISVSTFKAAVHTAGVPPANVEAVRFSVPYLIAARLCRGPIDLRTLDHDLVRNQQVRDLAERVEMVFSQEYEGLRPRRNPAKVTLYLREGRELSREVMNCLGDPLKPVPQEFLLRKFLDLATPVLGKSRAEDFVAAFQPLESVDNVRPLLRMLRPGE